MVHEVTEQFVNTVKGSHTVISRARLRVPDGEDITLPITAGNVSVDTDAATRRTCRVTMVDDTGDLVPEDLHHLLAPRQTEFDVYRGIRLQPGSGTGSPLTLPQDFTTGSHDFTEEDNGDLRMTF